MSKTKVAIIFGGANTEHEVSLKSAANIIEHIDKNLYEITLIGITKSGKWLHFSGDPSLIPSGAWEKDPTCTTAFLSPDTSTKGLVKIAADGSTTQQQIDVIFPVLHGKNGEDGSIQGLFQLANIPYVGCQVLGSAICMDKVVANIMFDAHKIRHTKWAYLTTEHRDSLDEKAEELMKTLRFPMYVKPANSGSSVGVSVASDKSSLIAGIENAFTHDKRVVIEEGIIGREVEVAVMGNVDLQAPFVGEIFSAVEGFYDYESKYNNPVSQTVIPADLPKDTTKELLKTAKQAFKALDCTGLSRVDFFVEDKTGLIYINEINTLPGFTEISMFPKLMQASGMSYTQLITCLIDLALGK